MSVELTNSQVNRLGDRLRKDHSLLDDPKALDAYRESFIDAYKFAMRTLRDLGLEPSGRIKTAISIVEKLKRESIRLSRLQDIAGCRVLVADIREQDRVVDAVFGSFPNAKVMDRRLRPNHGYRAVHVIVDAKERLVEIQIRTELQQVWAVWSEALANLLDHSIKYGGGPAEIQQTLALESKIIALLESRRQMLTAGLRPPDPWELVSLSDMMSGKSLGTRVLAAAPWAGSVTDLIRHEQEVKDRITREILEMDVKGQTRDFPH